MAAPEIKDKTHMESERDPELKGTLASVFILGLFLAIVWIGVYSLFVDRLG